MPKLLCLHNHVYDYELMKPPQFQRRYNLRQHCFAVEASVKARNVCFFFFFSYTAANVFEHLCILASRLFCADELFDLRCLY